ncbi:MAG: Minf_1886 family protein [Planctomycetota bacterium]
MSHGQDKADLIYQLVQEDGRYRGEAYDFTLEALNYTLASFRKKGRLGHINGGELCEGIRDYAEQMFGFLTKSVFRLWGISRTEDFGEIVFSMIQVELLAKQDTDTKEDFANGFDFDEVFEKSLIY